MCTKRWFLSSNARDIGILYIIFSLFAGIVGTSLAILLRIELAVPNMQFSFDDELYNVIITYHALIMIFFMIMPGLIGGFGNLLMPLVKGGLDMAFPKLNNLSYWLLPPSFILFLFAAWWRLYPASADSDVEFWAYLSLFALSLAAISSMLSFTNWIVTTYKTPEIGLKIVSLFGWALVITTILLLLSPLFLDSFIAEFIKSNIYLVIFILGLCSGFCVWLAYSNYYKANFFFMLISSTLNLTIWAMYLYIDYAYLNGEGVTTKYTLFRPDWWVSIGYIICYIRYFAIFLILSQKFLTGQIDAKHMYVFTALNKCPDLVTFIKIFISYVLIFLLRDSITEILMISLITWDLDCVIVYIRSTVFIRNWHTIWFNNLFDVRLTPGGGGPGGPNRGRLLLWALQEGSRNRDGSYISIRSWADMILDGEVIEKSSHIDENGRWRINMREMYIQQQYWFPPKPFHVNLPILIHMHFAIKEYALQKGMKNPPIPSTLFTGPNGRHTSRFINEYLMEKHPDLYARYDMHISPRTKPFGTATVISDDILEAFKLRTLSRISGNHNNQNN